MHEAIASEIQLRPTPFALTTPFVAHTHLPYPILTRNSLGLPFTNPL